MSDAFDKLPVALVEPVQSRTIKKENFQYLAVVDKALKDFAKNDAHAVFVPTADINHKTGYVDVIHFNAAGQKTIGQRIADGLMGLSK